jgi:hypothetical protein
MADTFQVYFKTGTLAPDAALGAALRSLKGYGLTVKRHKAYLTAGRPDSPEFDIGVSAEPRVREESAEIGRGTPHAAAMRECDARFEVSFASLDEALDEINTMMEVQVALQEACGGFLYLPWNGNLAAPDA